MVLRAALKHYSTADLAAFPAALVNIELEIPDWKGINATLAKLRAAKSALSTRCGRGDAVSL